MELQDPDHGQYWTDPGTPVPEAPRPNITIEDPSIEESIRRGSETDLTNFLQGPLSMVTVAITNQIKVILDLHGRRQLYGKIQAFDRSWNTIMSHTEERCVTYNERNRTWDTEYKDLGNVFVPGSNIRSIIRPMRHSRAAFCGFGRMNTEAATQTTNEDWGTIPDLGTIDLVKETTEGTIDLIKEITDM